ncbi:ABC transporter permease [Rhizobium sp. P28RR-XV]|uniref:ABC transporter permease n=1 Tax=Rhizobium sp. P28RR-XV TaxID=2726737 RepID=UPI001456EEB7|nr:ABC transporter permease [Rhizobium sp. P28RR-XV]NLR88203.1 ABC transporter permease [Rhizobium sp. P28RR-XV]
MATTEKLSAVHSTGKRDYITVVQIALALGVLILWEAVAASGLLFKDVVPSTFLIARAFMGLIVQPEFYANLAVTGIEVLSALVVGGLAGLAVGFVLGGSRFLGSAYEPYVHYLAPTPKIIFFPIMIMWFGVGPGSKVAMGFLSCFFPIALSVAAGMRQIDKVLIRVGISFHANPWQMVTKIYLPAMRAPAINGVRLGLGVAIIGVLLAETKLASQGLGFMIINSYSRFDMPAMYALLIFVFCVAALLNALLNKLAVEKR